MRILHTQEGITTRFPAPRGPSCHITNWRYPVCHKFLFPKFGCSTRMSLREFTATSSIMLFRQISENDWSKVRQCLLLQHFRSFSFGICLHHPHLHHSGTTWPKLGGCGSGTPLLFLLFKISVSRLFLVSNASIATSKS